MPISQQKAEIVRIEKLTGAIYLFTVKAPDIAAEARAGQFVMVQVGKGMDPLLRRPFSIHQLAEGGLVQILFKVVGRGTQALAELQAGQEIDILGPLGQGFIHNTEGRHYLVGGGIGIAPLLFLAQEILIRVDPADIQVLLGAATKDEIAFLVDDFEALGLAVHTATEDGSLGQQGLVTDLMTSLKNGPAAMVYGCGPYPMLRAVAAVCLDKHLACQVSLEAIMACGLGACLGCAVLRADMQGYIHVCKDGPVIERDAVAWL